MPSDEPVTAETLQQTLIESRRVAETTRDMLTDPKGAKILKDLQSNAERAIRIGRHDIAQTLLGHIKNIQDKEQKLRDAQKVSDEAERNAKRVLKATEG